MSRFLLLALTAALCLTAGGAEQREDTYMTAQKTAVRLDHALRPMELPEIAEEPEEAASVTISAEDAELIAKTMYGEYRGPDKLQQAGVAWCILNRCDAWGQTVREVVSAPYQFSGYDAGNPVLPELYDMAVDVLTRHQTGEGRVLPADYLWFTGNGAVNIYRNAYTGGAVWDWSLASPYEVS